MRQQAENGKCLAFYAFQILYYELNYYSCMEVLQKLVIEMPSAENTNPLGVEIYRLLWKGSNLNAIQ